MGPPHQPWGVISTGRELGGGSHREHPLTVLSLPRPPSAAQQGVEGRPRRPPRHCPQP